MAKNKKNKKVEERSERAKILIAAIEELNDKFFEKDSEKISTDISVKEMEEEIIETAGLIEAGDEFSDETLEVFEELEIELPTGKKEKKDSEEEEEEDPIEDIEEVEPKKEEKPKKKAKAKKTEKEVEKVKTPEKTAKAEKKTRAEVFKELIVVGGTKKELLKRMNDKYGGSLRGADVHLSIFLSLLLTMGYITKDEKGIFSLSK